MFVFGLFRSCSGLVLAPFWGYSGLVLSLFWVCSGRAKQLCSFRGRYAPLSPLAPPSPAPVPQLSSDQNLEPTSQPPHALPERDLFQEGRLCGIIAPTIPWCSKGSGTSTIIGSIKLQQNCSKVGRKLLSKCPKLLSRDTRFLF